MQITVRTRIFGDNTLKDTIVMANKACQECIDIGIENRTFNKTRLHHLTYRSIRKRFPQLNSSIVTAARDQASDMLKRLKLKKRPIKKHEGAIRLNHNTFKFFADSRQVSISTIGGRRKYAVKIPDYFSRYDFKESTAARIYIKRDKILMDIITDIDTPEIKTPNKILGIDRGAYNPAVTSDNQFFDSRRLRNIKSRYRYLRQQLQRAGTRSAKRHLKKLGERERRFVADLNHCIAKEIVNSNFDAFAFEELNVAAMKMRKRRGKSKKNISLIGSWSPAQLLQFVKYKAQTVGKSVILVNSHYTSQACNRCGDIRRANRNGRSFRCKVCSYTLHSDLNAARNIASLAKGKSGRLPVNQPIVACDDLKASLREELRASIVTSSAS